MTFRRNLTPVNAFGITFTTVGILLVFSAEPLKHAFVYGGPVVTVWAWLAASGFNIITSLCLSEMAACMPAAVGSLYFFTARLAPWHSKAFATWVAAWANLAAALGTTAYYALVTMHTLGSAARLARIAASTMPYDAADPSYGLEPWQEFAIYCAILLSWLALVSAPLSVTAGFITGTSLWQVFGGGALFGSLLALAPHKQSASYIFSGWVTVPRISGIRNVPYNVLVGLLFPITAQTGYETVLYFVEELLVHRRRRPRQHRPAGQGQLAPPLPTRPLPHSNKNNDSNRKSKASVHGSHASCMPQQSVAAAAQQTAGMQHQHPYGSYNPQYSSSTHATTTHAVSASGPSQPRNPGGAGGGGGRGGSGVGDSSLTTSPQWQQHRSAWASLYHQQLQQQQRLLPGVVDGGGGERSGGGGGGWRSQSVLPEAMYGGLAASCALALVFILLLLAAAPSLPHAVDPTNETLGRDPMSQITYDILKAAYGSGRGAPGLISVIAVGTYGSGMVCTAGTCRKLWAMATDGFVPAWISGLSPSTGVPVRAAVVATSIMLLPGLLLFVGDEVIEAVLSFVVVAVSASYLVPVVLRLLPASATGYEVIMRRVQAAGGFTLGRASRPLFWMSSLWLLASICLAVLPPCLPWVASTANWTPVASAAVTAAVVASWWMPRYGARRWFRGLASVGGVSYC